MLFPDVQKNLKPKQKQVYSQDSIRLKHRKPFDLLSPAHPYLHHSDCWVNLGRQRNMNLIFVSVNTERTNIL